MSIDVEYASLCNTLYYSILLLITLIASTTYTSNNKFWNKRVVWFLGFAIIIFFAFRPLTYKFGFGDTQGYAFFFNQKRNSIEIDSTANDIGYEYISFFLRRFDVVALFFVMGCLYIVPQIYVSKRLSKEHYGIIFLVIVCSFSFWGYGVNGMRNGAALALVMLGMIKQNKVITALLFIAALSIHGSSMLPIVAYCVNFFYNKPKTFIIIWGISVVLSIFVSNLLTEIIPLQDFIEDNRVSYLTTQFNNNNSELFSSTGYRWDFVLYSAVPIFIGYRKIIGEGWNDRIYTFMFNTYLICNTFWLYTMYIPYNNRFAYLSWFLYPILISYPFLVRDINCLNIKKLILFNYLFTFLMWLK